MKKYDRRTIAWPHFGIANVQNSGIDLLQRAERLVPSRFDRRHSCRFSLARLCGGRTDHAELGGRNRHYYGGKKAATIMVDYFGHFSAPSEFGLSHRKALDLPRCARRRIRWSTLSTPSAVVPADGKFRLIKKVS